MSYYLAKNIRISSDFKKWDFKGGCSNLFPRTYEWSSADDKYPLNIDTLYYNIHSGNVHIYDNSEKACIIKNLVFHNHKFDSGVDDFSYYDTYRMVETGNKDDYIRRETKNSKYYDEYELKKMNMVFKNYDDIVKRFQAFNLEFIEKLKIEFKNIDNKTEYYIYNKINNMYLSKMTRNKIQLYVNKTKSYKYNRALNMIYSIYNNSDYTIIKK